MTESEIEARLDALRRHAALHVTDWDESRFPAERLAAMLRGERPAPLAGSTLPGPGPPPPIPMPLAIAQWWDASLALYAVRRCCGGGELPALDRSAVNADFYAP